MTHINPITTNRLVLKSMGPAFLEACLAGDSTLASQLIGLSIPEEWFEDRWLMDWRLKDMRKDPALETWLLRAVGLRATGEMIGHIGFHTAPGAEYLAPYAPSGVEFGYTIYSAYRKHGYAREAAVGLMNWAIQTHNIDSFVLSISPENAPSQAIAQHFGFVKVATVEDEEDGPEDVFVRMLQPGEHF